MSLYFTVRDFGRSLETNTRQEAGPTGCLSLLHTQFSPSIYLHDWSFDLDFLVNIPQCTLSNFRKRTCVMPSHSAHGEAPSQGQDVLRLIPPFCIYSAATAGSTWSCPKSVFLQTNWDHAYPHPTLGCLEPAFHSFLDVPICFTRTLLRRFLDQG